MPGASEQTRRVKIANANWTAGKEGEDGQFGILLITDDDERHTMNPSPSAMVSLIALIRHPQAVVMWDPAGQTLITANLVGKMPWTEEFLESP